MRPVLFVSIPSRGFWFFEDSIRDYATPLVERGFNPLAGILVF